MKHKKNLEKKPDQPQNTVLNKFQKFLFLSVLFHVGLSLTMVVAPYLKKQKPAEVEIVLVETPAENEDIVQSKIKAAEEKKLHQVVQTNENEANHQLDQNANYLSAKNNTVRKETVAKNIGQFKNTSQKMNAAKQPEQSAIEKQIAKNTTDKKTESKLFDTGFNAYSALSKNSVAQKMAQKEHTFQNGSASQQASATQDHIETAEPSLMTQLNTREYKYYGYNMRIRTQLDQWYETKLRDQMKKLLSQGRSIASEDNKRTQLLIILDNKGSLVGVQVLGASGVRELDDAAVEAFRKAAPFPNPPKGMVDNDGTIKVRWDFVLS